MGDNLGPDFHYEYTSEGATTDGDLRPFAEERLYEWAEGYTDMVGAAVSVEEENTAETPHRFRARVVVYMRPDNIVGVEKAETDMQALKGALNAVERQIRKKREKLGKPWERPFTTEPPE